MAAEVPQWCGTQAGREWEEVFLAERSARRRVMMRDAVRPAARRVSGEIALLDTGGGVVGVRNDFDLARRRVRFTPSSDGARYRIAVSPAPDGSPLSSGGILRLGDDDSHRVDLPFAFRYFGVSYREVWVNSDGNLTFGEGDPSSSARSAGQLAGGPPRIAGLYRDLDPSVAGQVRVAASSDQVVITWDRVPDFGTSGVTGQTFELRLSAGGEIDCEYFSVSTDSALVGISAGGGRLGLDLIDLDEAGQRDFDRSVGERFEQTPELDVVRASQRMLEAFGDSYDYLVFFNDFGLRPRNAIAFQVPVRVNGAGYGLARLDLGRTFGSARRLQSVINMGPAQQYPAEPTRPLPGRESAGDNVLTVLGHELGHQYLSFVPLAGLLGRQSAHWSFFFNSDASLLEGNRWEDRGEQSRPRFVSVAAVAGYSALDRYLMGFGPLAEVPDSFWIQPFFAPFRPDSAPAPGAAVDGQRMEIAARQIRERLGRRTPDETVAQRHFRIAFVLVHREGMTPSPVALQQIEGYRRAFTEYFQQAARGQASVETTLRPPVHLSFAPAAGVVVGQEALGELELDAPRASPTRFRLRSDSAALAVPDSVTIRPGAVRTGFAVRGQTAGRATITAEPFDDELAMGVARIAVSSASDTRIDIRRDGSRLEVRVTDENELGYPGVPLIARLLGTGSVTPATAQTDRDGRAVFFAQIEAGDLEIGFGGREPVRVSGAPVISSVLNAASLDERLSPGALVSIFGAGFPSGAEGTAANVRVDSQAATVLRSAHGQLLVALPGVAPGPVNLDVQTPQGQARRAITVRPLAPAIFEDGASGRGAVSAAGVIRDFLPGETVEIYATGLAVNAPVEARMGGADALVQYQGPVAAVPGLWQVNAVIPAGLPPGLQRLVIRSAGELSNSVSIGIASPR